jgi:hypothetical protein
MGDRACESHGHRPRHGPAAFMGAANRGVPHIEPVSRMAETDIGMASRDWRRKATSAHLTSPPFRCRFNALAIGKCEKS